MTTPMERSWMKRLGLALGAPIPLLLAGCAEAPARDDGGITEAGGEETGVVEEGLVTGATPCEGNNYANNNHADGYFMGGPVVGLQWVPTVSGTISRLEIFTGEIVAQDQLAIWSDDGASPSKPLAPLATTQPFMTTMEKTWQGGLLSVPVNVVAGNTYWVVWDPAGGEQSSQSSDPSDIQQTYWGSYSGNVSGGTSWFGPFSFSSDKWKFRMFCGNCTTLQRGVAGTISDASIQSTSPTWPFGGNASLMAGTSGASTRQTLFSFDVSAIPPGSTVTLASVRLRAAPQAGSTTIQVHEVNSPWSEGTVTWSNFGGAYAPAVTTSFSNGGAGFGGPVSFDVTALADAWVNGAAPNNGVLLEHSGASSAFRSSETPGIVDRPAVDICYDPPTAPCTPPSCDDGDPCTQDSCDPATGCQHAALADGTTCADSDACNGTETCQGGSCTSGCADPVIQVSTGSYHSCLLRASGTVWCWGQNFVGQLGDGTTTDSANPVQVVGLTDAVKVEVAFDHVSTCALRATGAVVCWGGNYGGQLGNGAATHTYASTPTPQTVLGINDAVDIAVGHDHACAVRATGTIMCWGANYARALGTGNGPDSSVPAAVLNVSDAVKVAGGGGFGCAIRATGQAVCWGANNYGQCGTGSTSFTTGTAAVANLNDAVQIDAGTNHACVVRGTGGIDCWGINGNNALGNGGVGYIVPTPGPVTGITNALRVTTGISHTCALLTTGDAMCWGPSPVPVPVVGLSQAVDLSTNFNTACAVRAWGDVVCFSGDTGATGLTAVQESCAATAPLLCGDSNVCTADACDPAAGCVFTPTPGTSCDDGSVCTLVDTCDAAGACIGSSNLVCDDGDTCTSDACDPAGGCYSTFVPSATCDICTMGGPYGWGLDCEDYNDCTYDACDPMTGCTHTNAPDGDFCADYYFYAWGTCLAGVCQYW